MTKRQRFIVLVVAILGLATVGAFAVRQSLFAPAYSNQSGTAVDPLTTVPTGSFEPAAYGVPDTIAGYKVLAVINSNNTACVSPDDKRLVMLTDAPSEAALLSNHQTDLVMSEAVRLGLADYAKTIVWVGPGTTAEQVVAQARISNQNALENGCVHIGPIPLGTEITPTAP
jgi:hypothetical protein